MTLVDITFHANKEYANTKDLIASQSMSLIYIEGVRNKIDIEVIKHFSNKKMIITEIAGFRFFRGKNGFFHIPFRTLWYLKKIKPDLVLVQGLIFPVQVLALRFFVGEKTKIMIMHQACRPFTGVKKIIQKLADKYIHLYFFASRGNAKEWVESGNINGYEKIAQLPATLTYFNKQDKNSSRQKLGMNGGVHYIWVGRLNENKDPLTLLTAFEYYLTVQPLAKLNIIFQTKDLLGCIKEKIASSSLLQNAVSLVGYIPNHELITWYSAADYFISTSHFEGGSVAILEAMSCGCIPVVSNIPSSMKTIQNGEYGFYFTPGNAMELCNTLIAASESDQNILSAKIESHFKKEYSVESVGDKFYRLCTKLTGE
jgi:glycosyltransferase involved in cell wall biosynthesis